MKRFSIIQAAVLMTVIPFGTVRSRAQQAGPRTGWGETVVVEQAALEDLIAVSANGLHSLGLNSNGMVIAWGLNISGQCIPPFPNEGFTAVSAGAGFNLGLREDGTIAVWGDTSGGRGYVPPPNGGFRGFRRRLKGPG